MHTEQPWETAARECTEELRKACGKPLVFLNPSRLQKVFAVGTDDSPMARGNTPVHYTIFAERLSEGEAKLVSFEAKQGDASHRLSLWTQTQGEVRSIRFPSIAETVKMGAESFTHRHTFDAIKTLGDRLSRSSINHRRPKHSVFGC